MSFEPLLFTNQETISKLMVNLTKLGEEIVLRKLTESFMMNARNITIITP